ncbi:MAG: efflux transporter outer membrane subunit [Gammaproteobacteria bacterium]|nr:efflux transporter outer membrane subunit [Gammaproteobacteria bacterium]
MSKYLPRQLPPGHLFPCAAWVFARRALAVCTAGLALAGCVSPAGIGHQGKALEPAAIVPQAEYAIWPGDAWWQEYREPRLAALIAEALAANPGLAAAQARIAKAGALVAGAKSRLAPQVSAGFSSSFQRYPINGIFPPPLGGSDDSENRLAVDATWELDFFGRNRAALAAANAGAAASAAEAQAARLAVAAAVARNYFEIARLLAQREIAVATRDQRVRIAKLVAARVEEGLDSNVELRQAEGAIPQIEGEIARLDEAVGLTRAALATLVGGRAEATRDLAPALAAAPTPQLPGAIPSDLLAHRADVTAARWRVEAASHDIASTRAEFYPSVNLTAFAGLASLGLDRLFEAGSGTFGVAPAVRLPIFDAGRLRAKLSAANADLDGAIADYNQTLLSALQEVVSTITAIRALDRQMSEQRAAQAAAESAYELALQRYQVGLTNYLTVLTTESGVLQQRLAAADLKARALVLDVNLKRALGGGYRADAVASNR